MQRRMAGLAAALGMLAFPQSAGTHVVTESAPVGAAACLDAHGSSKVRRRAHGPSR